MLYYFEWLLYIPFYVLSFYVDIYYEVQLLLALWLVFPKTFGIDTIKTLLKDNVGKYVSMATKLATDKAKVAREKLLAL